MTYNEVHSLEAVILEMLWVLQSLRRSYKILIVDDGSSDSTAAVADHLSEKLSRVQTIHHDTNLGLGCVYRTGFQRSNGRFVTFFPADGQFNPAIVSRMAELIDNYDMVLGYLTGKRDSALSKFLSWGEKLFYKLLFVTFPRFQGILMFQRQILQTIPLISSGRGWAVIMELILKTSRAGFKTISIPTGELRPRRYGKSKVNNFRTILANLKEAITLKCIL